MNNHETDQKDITTNTVTSSEKNVCCGIYGLRNKINGKWYVGQSFDIIIRWYRAYEKLHCKKQRKLYNALLKYGYESFDKTILEECKPSIEILNNREDYWIKFYDSINNGYNIKEAGSRGKHSQETIEKIRIALIGKHPTEDTLQKMSAWQKGKIVSKEHRLKLSLSQKGIKRTPMSSGTKEKLSESIRLSWIKRRLKKVETTPSTV